MGMLKRPRRLANPTHLIRKNERSLNQQVRIGFFGMPPEPNNYSRGFERD